MTQNKSRMIRTFMRWNLFKNTLLGLAILSLTGCQTLSLPKQDVQNVHLFAFNDFHGHLEPSQRSITIPDPHSPQNNIKLPVGGASYLADAIDKLRSQHPSHAVISAGDLMSASPLISSLFLDEATIEVMNEIALDFNVIGNHELDRGTQELQRIQFGGCIAYTRMQPCQINRAFTGAKFDFLAANIYSKQYPEQRLFPAYKVKHFDGIPVAFIGLTLKTAPSSVAATGIQDLVFRDEAETVNALIPELKQQGIEAIVVVIHDGVMAQQPQAFGQKSCEGLQGPLLQILEQLDSEVDVVISGHTHQAYLCDYATRNPAKPFLLTSAGQYGDMITDIKLQIDVKSQDVLHKDARQIPVQSEPFHIGTTLISPSEAYETFSKSAKVEAILQPYRQAVDQIAKQVIAQANMPIVRKPSSSGESPLGLLIADAQQAAAVRQSSVGSDFALMNPGGIRADLMINAEKQIRFIDLYSVQPFANTLVTMTLSGQQIRDLLEQQWSGANASFPKILQPSAALSYQYNNVATNSPRARDIRINGRSLVDQQNYRVTVNSFLAEGGDNFSVLRQGTQRTVAGADLQALQDYLVEHAPVSAPIPGRIRLINE